MDDATDTLARANNTNAASIAKLLGAFAVGITLAAKLREGRDTDEYDEYEDNIL